MVSILLTPLLSMIVASLLYAVCLYRAYGALDTLSLYIYYELLIIHIITGKCPIPMPYCVASVCTCNIHMHVSTGDALILQTKMMHNRNTTAPRKMLP